MKFIQTKLEGVLIFETKIAEDSRGNFMKVFHEETFSQQGLLTTFKESYYSTSKKDVIRGMHFQIPPHDHAKIVYVSHGQIIDVVLDIRQGSPAFGQYETFELNDNNHRAVYIPSGFAHGFISLRDDTAVTYLQTTMRSAEHEGGVRFDSFGYNWNVARPIISVRDQDFPALKNFVSPFMYEATL